MAAVNEANKITATPASPIPVAFSLTDTQTQLVLPDGTQHLRIQNTTNTLLAWGIGTSTKLPVLVAGYIPPGVSLVRDKLWLGTNSIIYIRADEGAEIKGGYVTGEIW